MAAEADRPPLINDRDDPAATTSAEPAGRRKRRLWPLGLVVVVALVVARVFFLEPFRISGTSMTPTLRDGDRVLVDKRAYRAAPPRRGDLVVFHAPRSGDVTLKRVVGVPGDSVAIEDGILVVNGARPREPYTTPNAIDTVYFGPERVRAASVFVLGDNRADSIDSRDYGSVSRDALIGRVGLRLWPLSR